MKHLAGIALNVGAWTICACRRRMKGSGMPYAVYLDLDAAGSRAIDRLTGFLEEFDARIVTPGRLGHGPHLTLAVYDDLDAKRMKRALTIFSATTARLHLAFPGIGSFPGERSVLFAAPRMTRELLLLHDRYHRQTAAHGQGRSYYHPGSWVPHVTLAMGISRHDLGEAVAAVANAWAPIECTLDAIRLIHFDPVETLWLCPLTSGEGS